MEKLIEELKNHIVKELNLEEISPEDIGSDDPLFGKDSKLGLDSIDALEIILILEKNYGVHLENSAESRKVFKSVRTLAEYVEANSNT